MASSKELLSTLNRINTRIERLESSFQTEMTALKQENVKLRHTLAEIQQSPKNTNNPKDIVLDESIKEIEPLNKIVENLALTKSTAKPVAVFNHATYMTGVFAYQREDFQIAIDYFSNLVLDKSTKDITNNVLYWMADSYQQIGDLNNAIISLEKILKDSDSDHVDDALIKKGLLHRRLGQREDSLIAFNKLVNNFPRSEYAKLARMEIKRSEIYQ